MTIKEIAYKLNKLSSTSNHSFGELQQIRKKIKGLKKNAYNPFTDSSIKKGYAFHSGGRNELQFNIGKGISRRKNVLRYGVAYSLERGPGMFYPLEVFTNKIHRHNEFIKVYPNFFKGYSLYIHDHNHKHHLIENIKEIPQKFIEENNFIFIGKVINKSLQNISEKDLNTVLESFDELMEYYEFIETPREDETEIRVVRVCWNTNGWVKPSGRIGKSKSSAKSHEKKHGFGHEEWLFDMDKIYNSFHYGFLEPVRKFQEKYKLKKFDFLLYTVNSETKQKFWLGRLNNVEVLNKEMAEEIINHYRKVGWLNEMKRDLDTINLNGNRIVNEYLSELDIINVRFKPEEIKNIFEQPLPVEPGDKRITSTRYNLLKVKKGEEVLIDESDTTGYSYQSGNDGEKSYKKKITKTSTQKSVEHEAKHNEMSDKFLAYMKNKYGYDNVKRECKAFGNSRIDIVRRTKQGDIFYEIKTYNHLKTCIREALGQIFEYCLYPDVKNAIKLYLVSNLKPKKNFEKYIKHLNKYIKIPLGYIQFDVESNEIIQEL